MIVPELLTIGSVMAAFVFLRAFQQRNVAFDHYKWIMPTSWCMGLAEVYWVAAIATQGFSLPLALALGTGGGIGCLIAMYLHKKILGRKDDADIRHQVPRVPTPSGSIQSLRHSGGM